MAHAPGIVKYFIVLACFLMFIVELQPNPSRMAGTLGEISLLEDGNYKVRNQNEIGRKTASEGYRPCYIRLGGRLSQFRHFETLAILTPQQGVCLGIVHETFRLRVELERAPEPVRDVG